MQVCLNPPFLDGFTSILLQTLSNFGLNCKKSKQLVGFVKFYGEASKKITGRASSFFYGNGVKKIYGEGVKGLRRDLLIGYEHWLIAAQYSPP